MGAILALLGQASSAVATTFESCVDLLVQIRDVALGAGTPQEKLDQIVALINAEIGPPDPVNPTLSGDFAGTIPAGEVWEIVGDVNLSGDLIVEGTLTNTVDTFTIEGNGFQIDVRNGGRLELAGVTKSAWMRRGGPVVGWQFGDRLVVAPTAVDDLETKETTWSGDWTSTVIPSGDVTLRDGRVMAPEVVNMSQSIRFNNLSRIHFHSGAGVQSLRHVNLTNCGVQGLLDHYPIHFHLNGDSSRGSLIQGVVVDGGNNHAFVPHGSHGITFRDVAAVHGRDDQFWWNVGQPEDDSHDTVFEHALVLGLAHAAGSNLRNLTGFKLRKGNGNVARDVAAVAVNGGVLSSGFDWNETGEWVFEDFVAHNIYRNGIRVWNNSSSDKHDILDGVTYNCSTGISHGAYLNRYEYRDIVLGDALVMHANSKEFDNVFGSGGIIVDNVSGPRLTIAPHNKPFGGYPVTYRNVDFDEIIYAEKVDQHPSWNQFHDSSLTPANFTITEIHLGSIIEILEGGVLVARFENGVWA